MPVSTDFSCFIPQPLFLTLFTFRLTVVTSLSFWNHAAVGKNTNQA